MSHFVIVTFFLVYGPVFTAYWLTGSLPYVKRSFWSVSGALSPGTEVMAQQNMLAAYCVVLIAEAPILAPYLVPGTRYQVPGM